MQSPTRSRAPTATWLLPGGTARPARPRVQDTPPGYHWISLAHIFPSVTVASVPSCRAMAPAPSTTYAFDTVNLPEFPITYLFWVLTLCTETAAHMCFFRKRKRKKNHNRIRNSVPCTFWFFALLACMCLAEGTRPIGFGDLRPGGLITLAENPRSESRPAPPCSISCQLEWRRLGGMGHRVTTGSQGASGGCLPAPSSHSRLRFVGYILDIHPWGRVTGGLGVTLHPSDPSMSQRLCFAPAPR